MYGWVLMVSFVKWGYAEVDTVLYSAKNMWSGAYEWNNKLTNILKIKNENPYALHREMAEEMISNVLIVRENSKLKATLEKIDEFEERWNNVNCVDTTDWSNPVPSFINQLWNMIQLSKIITKGALLRDEFRGSHYKPEFDLNQPSDFRPET